MGASRIQYYNEKPAFEITDEEIIPGEGWKTAVEWARTLGHNVPTYERFKWLGSALAGALSVHANVVIDLSRFSTAAEPPLIPTSYEEGWLHDGFNAMSQALGVTEIDGV